MAGFFITFEQIVILFILIFVGFLLTKIGKISDDGIKTCTNITLYVVTPCVIVKSYMREFSHEMMRSMLLSLGASFIIHICAVVIAHIFYKKKCEDYNVLRFATVFSNAAYMALPLQEALLGSDGVFYGASFIAVFNLVAWTYGVWCMKKGGKFDYKNLLNPAIIAIFIGVVIFVFSLKLPAVIVQPITFLAALNTPLPMLITGACLAKSNFLCEIKNKNLYIVSVLKLVVVPLVSLVILHFLGLPKTLLVSMIVSASAPTASMAALFSVLFNANNRLAVSIVSFSTLVSAITMPLIITLAQAIG